MPAFPGELETRLGYAFKNPSLLTAALTRQAYVNENPGTATDSMDALATVGDAVLGAVVAARLYERGTHDKGELTREKIRDVNRDRTRAFAIRFRLDEYIRWGKGEEKNRIWEQGNQAFDTAFEALVGAIFLDVRHDGGNGLFAVQELLEQWEFFKTGRQAAVSYRGTGSGAEKRGWV